MTTVKPDSTRNIATEYKYGHPTTQQGGVSMTRSLCSFALLTAAALNLGAQENAQPQTEDKRILWIFTNHRTTDDSTELSTLTPGGKFAIAWGDATDRAIFFQTTVLAGIGQATNGNPSFGQGVEGYAKRYLTTYADFAIENVMTEGLFPTLLHQDPRYFRRHEGTRRSRLVYAVSRLFITRSDSGRNQFNYSEVVGAATSLAISNAYYPDGRSIGNNVGRYAVMPCAARESDRPARSFSEYCAGPVQRARRLS
jgi:hypothetical protein